MRGLVIIPAFNEAATIRAVLTDLRSALPPEADILVVNDCSSDDTVAGVRGAGVKLCSLPCNLGYPNALSTGIRYGLDRDYEWFAFMDADGQHRPEDMNALIHHFNSGTSDMVIGSRWVKSGRPSGSIAPGRRWGMLFFAWLTQRLTGRNLTDTTSGMKIMNRIVARELLSHNFGDFHSEVLIYLHDRGFHMEEHPIVVHERTAGVSMYNMWDAVFYPVKNLILIIVFKLNSIALRKVR